MSNPDFVTIVPQVGQTTRLTTRQATLEHVLNILFHFFFKISIYSVISLPLAGIIDPDCVEYFRYATRNYHRTTK